MSHWGSEKQTHHSINRVSKWDAGAGVISDSGKCKGFWEIKLDQKSGESERVNQRESADAGGMVSRGAKAVTNFC